MECGEIGSLGSHALQHVAKERAGDFVTAMHLPHKMVDGNAAAMESKITTVKTTPAKVRMQNRSSGVLPHELPKKSADRFIFEFSTVLHGLLFRCIHKSL